jgi:DNA-binding IclR family transcriptional regulator
MSKIVFRVLDLFEAFAEEKRPLSLSELSRILDIPPSSCHGVLRAMEQRGFLYELKARAGFYPTARLLDLGQVIVEHDVALSRLEPLLGALRDLLDESVFLAKANGLSIVYLAVLHADKRLRLALKPGDHVRSLYASSAGKAVLSTLEPQALSEFLASIKLTALTPRTVTSKLELQKDLKLSLERGWFLNREETVEDSLTVSAPFQFNGLWYVVTVAGSLKPMERKLDRVTDALLKTIRQVSTMAP